MSTTAPQPVTTPIPVQLSESEFLACILPHLAAQARAEVQTGLSSRLQPHLVDPRYGHAMEVLARPDRPRWEAGHPLHHRLQSLCQMGG